MRFYQQKINVSSLHTLCLSDCPITELATAQVPGAKVGLTKLILSHTGVRSWAQVDTIRDMLSVKELRMMDCPFNADMDPVSRRQHVIARLPNVDILNGGDPISENEREQVSANQRLASSDSDPSQAERALDRKSTRLNSSHSQQSRMPSSA